MNAYELAEKIIDRDCYHEYIIDAVRMLRMQADEITALREQLNDCQTDRA